jgi:eukaryotic translation initiation factor 2C
MTSDLPKDKSAYQQYLTNLCMKINMKGGGINHQVAFTAGKLNLNKTIVFGADVTHPGASQCIGYPSIACVVASVDRYFMNYPGSMRLQAGRQEVNSLQSLAHILHF